MKKLFFASFICTVLFISFASSIVILELNAEPGNANHLAAGKSYISINVSYLIYARDLVKANPKIDSISYLENNRSVGYINIFGGIGKNFLIEKNKIYEISTKEEIELVIPKNE
jgi:hypothetical protein